MSNQSDKCKIPKAFWRALEEFGYTPMMLLRQARLPLTLHLREHSSISTDQYFALMRGVQDLLQIPAVGLRMLQQTDTSVYPPSSLAAFYAQDYRDGIYRLARYKRLCTPEIFKITENVGDTCTIVFEWPRGTQEEPQILVDITLAMLIELGRRATGHKIVPRRIELKQRDEVTQAHRTYFGCPIKTGAKQNMLVLESVDWERPFFGHNPEMLAILTPALNAALGEVEAHASLAEHIKVILKRRLASGQPTLTDLAQELGVSERTLQRRMMEKGVTFRSLLSEARRELVHHLLVDPEMDITEVACLLGYQDTTSFYRAFREWEGISPNRWRAMNMH
ncbi:AraC family transcriptional regulator [Swingsia samuiensis]|uniref:AraC family transcriptional regulator n=1 Tax=Swingsia samuiensis TaxID=1293412 RepID=A0A4Y6UJJ3_9PROT|nr:AraC family transcriptional regulator [Swingsia samuiensis]QDH17224.1 AraC family transcriptional regulator [Swingsia samuiensis]